MRIRQIRPEFFTDPVTARLPAPVQVTYIGLWCVADDAGWLVWDVQQLGALLYPYSSVHVRTRVIERASVVLAEAGRLVVFACHCGFIPTLAAHQRIGGNKAFPVRDLHRVHTSMDKSSRNVTLGNVTVGNGTPARASEDAAGEPSMKERVAAHGYKPS